MFNASDVAGFYWLIDICRDVTRIQGICAERESDGRYSESRERESKIKRNASNSPIGSHPDPKSAIVNERLLDKPHIPQFFQIDNFVVTHIGKNERIWPPNKL